MMVDLEDLMNVVQQIVNDERVVKISFAMSDDVWGYYLRAYDENDHEIYTIKCDLVSEERFYSEGVKLHDAVSDFIELHSFKYVDGECEYIRIHGGEGEESG
jgi:hypothetical protein